MSKVGQKSLPNHEFLRCFKDNFEIWLNVLVIQETGVSMSHVDGNCGPSLFLCLYVQIVFRKVCMGIGNTKINTIYLQMYTYKLHVVTVHTSN